MVLRLARLLLVAEPAAGAVDKARAAIKPKVRLPIRPKAAALPEEAEARLPPVSPVKPACPVMFPSNP